jgi:hypothetical protein
MRPAHANIIVAIFFLGALGACDEKEEPKPEMEKDEKTEKKMDEGPLDPPLIPSEPTTVKPSLATTVEGEEYDAELHSDVETCSECHAEITEQWRDSVHAYAAVVNPFFRVSFDEFVKDVGREKAAFCASCHDPTLAFDGTIKKELDPAEKRGHLGVTCATCHGMEEATLDGNGSYVLSTAPIPLPEEGDPESLKKHLARVGKPTLRTNELCMSCHRSFLTPATGHEVFIPGINDVSPYRHSRYAGNPTTRIDSGVDEKMCTDCHMPEFGPDKLASHRFAGGHASLAAAIGSEEQLEAVREMVTSAASVDIGAVGVGEVAVGPAPEKLEPGQKVWADVVVYNDGTGHTFPGGALDLRDTWIEVELQDADGNVLASAGTEHEESGADPSAAVLHAVMAGDEGGIVKRHRVRSFRTPVNDFAIAPRDALVSRYVWMVPEKPPTLPLRVEARLRHRRVHKPLADRACEESKTERGKAFARHAKEYTGRPMDGCVEQPIIEVGSAWANLGDEERSNPDKPQWRRQWERGLGLTHNVQESLPEAIDAFETAMKLLPEDAPDIDRARILFSLGEVASRQGRRQAAMDYWAKAEKLVGEQPSIHFARGNAHQRTFHNEDALMWYQKAAKLVDDDRVWQRLAISAGSVSEARVAYDAALAGLRHEPRDPHLLRSQMLALRRLEAKEEWKGASSKAFSAYKRDEQAANVRDKCSANDEYCLEERQPMQITELK